MAVYGIGFVLDLIEEISRRQAGVNDPMIRKLLDDASLRETGGAATGFPVPPAPKRKRKATAYSKRYGKAFKRLAPKYKKKDGSWKKDGFKRCAAAARRAAKK
jgi:hypothetical protein